MLFDHYQFNRSYHIINLAVLRLWSALMTCLKCKEFTLIILFLITGRLFRCTRISRILVMFHCDLIEIKSQTIFVIGFCCTL